MISRRLLRIKALMALYAFNRRDDNNLPKAETELMFSVTKTYDLYHYIILLLIEVADVAIEKIEQALHKKMPTLEDLNPEKRFVNNKLIAQIRKNKAFIKYIKSSKLSWVNYPHIPKLLYGQMTLWGDYKAYIKSTDLSYASDRKFVIKLVTELFAASADIEANLEEQSIYWNDDLGYVTVMIEKTLKKFKENTDENMELMPMFKNQEDEKFVRILMRKTVMRKEECTELIDRNTANWEIDRIALMDILVMQLAIVEMLEFPEIPVKVTLNEYIEIAKYYCTSKSSTFVNGILDNIVREIREKGILIKFGRGLIGELAKE